MGNELNSAGLEILRRSMEAAVDRGELAFCVGVNAAVAE
jgi:hypothetical protein